MAMEVYHIQYQPRIETPPPTFSKALKCPKLLPIEFRKEDTPPPTYRDYMKTAQTGEVFKTRKPLTDFIMNIPPVHYKTSPLANPKNSCSGAKDLPKPENNSE